MSNNPPPPEVPSAGSRERMARAQRILKLMRAGAQSDVEPPTHTPTEPEFVDVIAEGKRLDDRFAEVEARLAQIPWKTECEVISGSFRLAFHRSSRGWVLSLGGTLVRDSSVQLKLAAITTIPSLLKEMKKQYEEKRAALHAAHRAMDELDTLMKGGI